MPARMPAGRQLALAGKEGVTADQFVVLLYRERPRPDLQPLESAVVAKRDVWGNDLIGRPNGPTYAAARRLLKPLLYARGWKKSLTTSGLYYLPFAQPLGVRGATAVALHVADGSEILSQTATGPRLTVFVGRYGLELADGAAGARGGKTKQAA